MFNVANMSFNAFHENKILANISGFTVCRAGLCLFEIYLNNFRLHQAKNDSDKTVHNFSSHQLRYEVKEQDRALHYPFFAHFHHKRTIGDGF